MKILRQIKKNGDTLVRVRTGPVHGSGPGQSKTGPDRSLIFFWTGAGPCVALFDRLCTRRRAIEGHAAVWQIAKRRSCVRRLLLSVGLIAQQRRGLVGWGGWAGHEPTATTYRTHKGRSVGTMAAADIKGSCRRKFPRRRRCM